MDDDVLSPSSEQHIIDPAPSGPAAPAPHFTLGVAAGGRATSPPGEKRPAHVPPQPPRTTPEPHPSLRALGEGLPRLLETGLTAMLRTPVGVKLAGVELLAYQHFVARLDNPTCFNVLSAEPLPGCLVLDISPMIIYPMIDRLLGGGCAEQLMALRPLTEIEMRIVARIVGVFAEELRAAWRPVLEIHPELLRVETRAESSTILAPDQPIAVIGLDVALGAIRGMMSLGVPQTSVERLGDKSLAADAAPTTGGVPGSESDSPSRPGLVSVRVELASARIAKADLAGLQPGDIITTEKSVHSPLEVAIDGTVRFRAAPGALGGRKAIRIEEPVADPAEG